MSSYRRDVIKPAVLLAIWISAAFWAIESSIYTVFFKKGTLLEQIFSPGGHELWIRLLVIFFIFLTSILGITAYERRRRIKLAVKREKEKSQAYLDVAAVIFTVIDQEQKIRLINRKGYEVFGYPKDEIIGKNWFDTFIPEKDRDEVKSVYEKLMAGEVEPVEYYENPVLTKSGEERLIAWHNTILRDEAGNITGTLSSGEDITERKRAEEALRESEEEFRSLIENQGEGIGIVDENECFLFANPAAEKIFGAKPGELVGRNLSEFLDSDTYSHIQDQTKMRRRGKKSTYDIEIARPDGEKRLINVTVTPKTDKEGKFTGAFGIFRDITEHKQMEEALRESETKYRTLFSKANDAIFLMDEDIFIDCNDRTLEIFKCTKDQIIGHPPYEFSPLSQPDGCDSIEKATEMINATLNGKPQFFYWKHSRADGTLFDAEVSLNKVELEGKSHIQAIVRDITERKLAEEALIASEERYRKLVENATEGIVVVQDGTLRFVNPLIEKFIGYNHEELLSKPFIEFIHPDDRAMVVDHYQKRLRGERVPEKYDLRAIHKEGETIWLEVGGVRITWEGKPATLNFLNNITERKRAEQEKDAILNINRLLLGELDMELAMQNLSLELRELIPHHLLAFTLIHKELNQVEVIFTAPEAQSNLNSAGEMPRPYRENLQGSLTQQILHERRNRLEKNIPDAGTDFDRNLQNLGMKSYVSMPLINVGVPVGMLFLASAQEKAFDSRHGELLEQIHLQLVLWVQHHKLIEQLSDSEAKFRNLFDNSNDAIYILQGTRFVYTNRRFEELLEYKLDEVNGPDFNFIDLVAPESIPLIEERSRRVDAGEKLPPNYEFKGLSKSGNVIDFDVNVSYITFDGEPAVQGILRDISERKRFEEKEKEMQIELMQHSKLASIGLLAAGIAHNLNVPLQGISNHIELLKMTRDDVPYLDSMLDQVQHISAIINNMLHKSRQEQDQSKRDIDLNQLLVGELNFLDADLTFKHEVEKEYCFDPKLPTIHGVYSDFSQALLNVIKNALDAMHSSEEKKLSVKTEASSDGGIMIEVIDTGKGIPQEHLEHIFNPFFSTKPPAGEQQDHEPFGTGLGLSTTYQLLKKYEARFDVESGDDRGTAFRIFLPGKESDTSDEVPEEIKESDLVLEEALE